MMLPELEKPLGNEAALIRKDPRTAQQEALMLERPPTEVQLSF